MKSTMYLPVFVLSLPAFCILTTSGCTPYSPFSVNYSPYSQQQYLPKVWPSPLIYDPTEVPKRQFTKIGRLSVTTNSNIFSQTSWDDIIQKFGQEAVARGADGIIAPMVNSTPYQYQTYTPGYTTYDPTTTYHSGNISGTYGTHYNYSGSSTSYTPVYHPGYTWQHFGVVNCFAGDLIVLLDKDTWGYIGVQIDHQAQNIDGLRIAVVYDGSPAAQEGLASGDVFTKVNGKPIRDYGAFLDEVSQVGVPVDMEYSRNGHVYEATVTPVKGFYGEVLPEAPEK